jgi:hypothetical protein
MVGRFKDAEEVENNAGGGENLRPLFTRRNGKNPPKKENL